MGWVGAAVVIGPRLRRALSLALTVIASNSGSVVVAVAVARWLVLDGVVEVSVGGRR